MAPHQQQQLTGRSFFCLPPVQGTIADGAPIVPISAQLKYNVDVVCEYIVKRIPIPIRDFTSAPNMIVIRSFDVNKPGAEVDDIKGGVAGGSILHVSGGRGMEGGREEGGRGAHCSMCY